MTTVNLDDLKALTDAINKTLKNPDLEKVIYVNKEDSTVTVTDLADAINKGITDFSKFEITTVKKQLINKVNAVVVKDYIQTLQSFLTAYNGLTTAKQQPVSFADHKEDELQVIDKYIQKNQGNFKNETKKLAGKNWRTRYGQLKFGITPEEKQQMQLLGNQIKTSRLEASFNVDDYRKQLLAVKPSLNLLDVELKEVVKKK